MNTIEVMLEALKELCEIVEDAIAQKSAKDLDSFTLQPAVKAITLGEAELRREPDGFIRKWAKDGEVPTKEKNSNGRMAWPTKFKFMAVTQYQVLASDLALFTRGEIK